MRSIQTGRGERMDEMVGTETRFAGTAMAVPALDQRSDPTDFVAVKPLDSSDTTSILHGSALLGRAAWSANRMGVNDPIAAYEKAVRLKDAEDAREAREREHLAAWNTQMTSVGGVEMTNEEAQVSRRHVLDNADATVDRAIAKGELGENDRAAFKRWMARKIELEEKRGRGTITAAEAKEEAEGDRTKVGHVGDAATGRDHQVRGMDATTTSPTANAMLANGNGQALATYNVFQAASVTPDQNRRETVAPLAAKVQATGLGL